MARYATSYYDIEAVMLVRWNGQLYGIWDDSDEKIIRLVPCEVLASFHGDEDSLKDVLINAPLREIQLLESVKADQSDMYRFGHGTERNPEKAWAILSQLYRKTDERRITKVKYADIVLRMGYCYRDGIGVEPDHKQAYEFFMKAQKAIEARMKREPEYGDNVVANNIQKAIESIGQH